MEGTREMNSYKKDKLEGMEACIKILIDGVFTALDVNDSKLCYLVVTKKTCKRNQPNSLKVFLQEFKSEDI